MSFPDFMDNVGSKLSAEFWYGAYNICFLIAFILISPFWIFRMLRHGKYRRTYKSRLGLGTIEFRFGKDSPRPIWIHALSVGETLSAVSLVRALAEHYPNVPLIFSTSTETGQQTAARELRGLSVKIIYFPLDVSYVVKRMITEIYPCLFVLIETDLWPNFLRELYRRGIPSVLVNGRISSSSFKRYRIFRFFMKQVLSDFQSIGMQAPLYANRMLAMGALGERVFVGGNLKYDQVHPYIDQTEKEDLIKFLGWAIPRNRILVAGSTHDGEEEILFKAFSKLLLEFSDAVLIVAPRNLERVEKVIYLAQVQGIQGRKLSDPIHSKDQIVVIDRMGELSRLYAVGEVAFVGGSMVREGGHNLLEPAAQRKPVVFGPYMDDFQEMAELMVEAGGGRIVSNQEELFQAWKSWLNSPLLSEQAGASAYEVWETNRGALQNYLHCLERFLNP